jgi:hypothetical protein
MALLKSTPPTEHHATTLSYDVPTAWHWTVLLLIKPRNTSRATYGSPGAQCRPGWQAPGISGASIEERRTRVQSEHRKVSPSWTDLTRQENDAVEE